VKIQGQLTETFGIERGLRQYDALSATPFHIVLEKLIRNIATNPNRTIFNTTRLCMSYADGMLILGRSIRAIKETVTQIKELQYTQDWW
jgi:hypothetical protein